MLKDVNIRINQLNAYGYDLTELFEIKPRSRTGDLKELMDMTGGLNANIIIIGIIIFIVINIVIEASLIKCGHTMFKDKKSLTGFKESAIVAINLS